MTQVRKALLGALGGAAVFALLALAAVGWGRNPVGAAGLAGGTASATPTMDEQQAIDAVFARFAARLGTDEAAINAAFVGAANDTADQAVRDGQITAEDAAAFKAMVAKLGLKGLLASADPGDDQPGNKRVERAKDKEDRAQMAAWDTIPATIGLDGRQLKDQLAAGKSLAEIAQGQHVEVAKLRATMLVAAKIELDTAVRDGAISQADADVRYAEIARWADEMINQHMVVGPRERVSVP